ncbi:MBL fold metallo-hydrolase [Nocardia sp. CA-135953]|uniref:MBL fold metallo-hydrolase n=1 Tax=Nocardia sp. CA-135953 TaxID=3239978 RepID=UPI003D976476
MPGGGRNSSNTHLPFIVTYRVRAPSMSINAEFLYMHRHFRYISVRYRQKISLSQQIQLREARRMRLTIVGNRAAMPADGAASSGYLVETSQSKILLDCGPGIAVMLSNYIHASRLDAIVISHMHMDHCYDVLPIGKQVMHHAETPDRRIKLFVPEGARVTLDRLAELFPVKTVSRLNKAFELAYEVIEYQRDGIYALADCTVGLVPMVHSEPDCGVRIDSSAGSIGFTGDTGWNDNLVTLAADVDIFLAEATLVESDQTSHGHLSATEVGKAAAAGGARSVVLTHFGAPQDEWQQARLAEAAAEFDGPVHISRPGMRFWASAESPQ